MPTRLRLPLLSGLLSGLLALSLPAPALAQHAHGAHEHGVADLAVALEGRMLQIELISPLDNLVGFEHAPGNDAQRAALADAERRLLDGEAMFALSATAGCAIREVEIESPWPQSGRKRGHGPAHDHAQPSRGEHEDMVVSYGFECTHPEALRQVELRAFAHFPRLQRVRAEFATPRGQGAGVLTPGAPVLAL